MTYKNGQAPRSALRTIDGTPVTPDVYERVTALQAYAETVGRAVHVIQLGGYADLAVQKARQTNNNSASKIPVAKVGYSTHGIYSPGRVDLGSSVTSYTDAWLSWLLTVTPRFGLRREFGADDPNHFIVTGAFAGGPTTPLEDDMPLNDNDLTTIRSMVAEIVQRENRSRLYYDTDKKLYVAIAWDLPSGDPGKVAYSTSATQLAQLKGAYEVLGDTPQQAVPMPHASILTLINLARGTDGVYKPPAGFLP